MAINDITNALLLRLSSALDKSPDSNNYIVLECIAGEFEEISEVLTDLTTAHHIGTATAASLEKIVDLLGVERISENDPALRGEYYIELNRRRSCGSVQEIKILVAQVTGFPEDGISIIERVGNPPPSNITLADRKSVV